MRGRAAISIRKGNQSEDRAMVLHGRVCTAPGGCSERSVFGGEFLVNTMTGVCTDIYWAVNLLHHMGHLHTVKKIVPSKILVAPV